MLNYTVKWVLKNALTSFKLSDLAGSLTEPTTMISQFSDPDVNQSKRYGCEEAHAVGLRLNTSKQVVLSTLPSENIAPSTLDRVAY